MTHALPRTHTDTISNKCIAPAVEGRGNFAKAAQGMNNVHQSDLAIRIQMFSSCVVTIVKLLGHCFFLKYVFCSQLKCFKIWPTLRSQWPTVRESHKPNFIHHPQVITYSNIFQPSPVVGLWMVYGVGFTCLLLFTAWMQPASAMADTGWTDIPVLH